MKTPPIPHPTTSGSSGVWMSKTATLLRLIKKKNQKKHHLFSSTKDEEENIPNRIQYWRENKFSSFFSDYVFSLFNSQCLSFFYAIELSFYFFYNIIFFYLFFFTRRKITRMTLIISVIYILTWIPNSVIFLLLRFTDHVTPNSPVDQLGILLVTFNSCVNPIVYTLHSTPFRQRIRSMLLCKPRFSRNAIAPVAYATTHQRVEQDVDVTSYDNEDFVENGLECGSQLERSRQSVSDESTSSSRQN